VYYTSISMVSVIKKGNNLTIHFFNLETLSNNIIISKILFLCSKKIKWCEYLPNDLRSMKNIGKIIQFLT